ncbi:unnamed protein product [Rotaria sp. Silwood2]|nr:unnamed protein product [Rotaria sp. Silwood2]
MITVFDNLSDLSLIEILSYLSCADALWAFSNISARLTTLLTELGFYRHANLSSTRYYQFQTILPILRLNEIESLVIDCYASSIQLRKWPYLPRLITLRLKGVRNVVDVFNFAQQHAKTLMHLTVESSDDYQTGGLTKKKCYPPWNLCEFVQKVLRRLSALRLLDLGMETSFFLHLWPLKTIPTHLIYLRITLTKTQDLLHIMSTTPLACTLQQLHIKMSVCNDINRSLHAKDCLPRMEALHTFTFVNLFRSYCSEEWTLLNVLTTSSVMPILRRINFSIVIARDDLDRMTNSALFTDYRHVDIHYALIINDSRQHFELREYVPRGSQFHPRQIASATFISEYWPHDPPFTTPEQLYFEKRKKRQHLFYTLPWIFTEFYQLSVRDIFISDLQVFPASTLANTICPSRLVKLNIQDNHPSPTTFFSHIVISNQVTELRLSQCDKKTSVNLSNITHLILTDSLDSLNNCSLSTRIRSIQITLNHKWLRFGNDDWNAFRRLSTLPMLKSLRVLLRGMHTPPDDTSCQIIAETAVMVSDFCFCFRRRGDRNEYDIDIAYTKHSLFIKQLQNHILALPLNEKPYVVVEKYSCGIFIWF